MIHFFRRYILITTALLICSSTFVCAEDEKFDPFHPPGRFVNLGLHVMYVDCMGDKPPTVMIDVGLADTSANWYGIAKELSKSTRTCLYDRAGYGWSDPGPGERTTAQIVHELHMLIEFAKIPGPYVLVGHSFGGFTARYFSSMYPKNTVGVVLVESSHPDQIYRLSDLDKVEHKAPLKVSRHEPAPENMSEFEKRWYFLNSSRKATFAQMEELRSFKDSAYQVKYSPPVPDIPLAIITRGISQLPVINGVSLEAEWQDMQKDLLKLSKNSWQEIVDDAGHDLYRDAPGAVIKNVLKVVDEARSNMSTLASHHKDD